MFKKEGMKYPNGIRLFRNTLLRLLKRLAQNGCGDGGWCECLLCRIMRVVQTEQFRNKPIHKSSFPSPSQPSTLKTRMVHWRGGLQEFAIGSEFESVAYAPWYAIKLTRRNDGNEWIYWIDYAGPPQIYLTKKAAKEQAKALRKQYKGSYYKKIEVINIGQIK